MIYDKLKNFSFMKYRKIYYCITVALIVISIGVGLFRGYNFGIDFTGGALLQFDMGQKVKISEVQDILKDQDIEGSVIYSGDDQHGIIIKTTDSMDNEARGALLEAMEEAFGIEEDALQSVSNIGPSVGETLRSNAAKAVAVAVVLMLIYIAIRFMVKYGIAAILALCNTILLMIGYYGLFHVSINSPFIAAMLTILGYGINDTIVIFDRIRENTGGRAIRSISGLEGQIDESIRQTVGRSIMTSLTTIAVMIPIIVICGSTVRSYILPILVGVIASTLTSIFIATSLWYDIMRLTDKNSPKARAKQKAKRQKKQEKEKLKLQAQHEKEQKQKAIEKERHDAEKKQRAEEKKAAAEKRKAEKEAEAAANADKPADPNSLKGIKNPNTSKKKKK